MLNPASRRRLKWRLGRKIYMDARGEQRFGTIDQNGETMLQKCVIKHNTDALVAFDIGANQGEWTEHVLSALPSGRKSADTLQIHAFEPVPSTATMFRDRIAPLDPNGCVTLHEHAMSDAEGTAEIGVYGAGAGTNSLHFSQDSQKTETVISISLKSVDAVVEAVGIEHIHMIKCDTEGHDAKVIMGAKNTLTAGKIDVLQFEYNHRWVLGRAFLKDIFDLIDGMPYCVARVDEQELTVFKTWHPELDRFFQSNYVLVHDRARSWFTLREGHFDGSNTYA